MSGSGNGRVRVKTNSAERPAGGHLHGDQVQGRLGPGRDVDDVQISFRLGEHQFALPLLQFALPFAGSPVGMFVAAAGADPD